MLGLFPDFPRGMGNLLRHHPLGAMRFPCEEAFCSGLSTAVFFLLSIVALGQFFSAVMPNPIVATSISLVFTSPSLVLSGYTLFHHCVACVLSENRAGLSADAFCHRLSQCGIDGMAFPQ